MTSLFHIKNSKAILRRCCSFCENKKVYVFFLQCPPKVLGQFKLSVFSNVWFWVSIIWTEDHAPRFTGPDLDRYCLQRPLKINISLEIVGKYFDFVPELFEGTSWSFGYVKIGYQILASFFIILIALVGVSKLLLISSYLSFVPLLFTH